ncbi:hypothetical protein B0A69_21540 [Chryseobacterium shigense]|nr:hypothetical protein B0A69_21540 [Chryseobacterium shigense]
MLDILNLYYSPLSILIINLRQKEALIGYKKNQNSEVIIIKSNILTPFVLKLQITFSGFAMAGISKLKLSTKIQISTKAQNVNFRLFARYCQTLVIC